MKITTINKGDTAVCTVFVPSSMAEVTVAQYAAYETARLRLPPKEKAIFESQKDFDELTDFEQQSYIKALLKMIAAFGAFEVVEGQEFDPLDLPLSAVTTLSLQFLRTVVGYIPVPISSFTHNGTTYNVPITLINSITNEAINPDLSVRQTFTALQYERKITQVERAQNCILAVKYVSIVAILCTKEGEDFSQLEEGEFDKVIEKRILEFQTLPMDTILNVMFFFGILPKA